MCFSVAPLSFPLFRSLTLSRQNYVGARDSNPRKSVRDAKRLILGKFSLKVQDEDYTHRVREERQQQGRKRKLQVFVNDSAAKQASPPQLPEANRGISVDVYCGAGEKKRVLK